MRFRVADKTVPQRAHRHRLMDTDYFFLKIKAVFPGNP